MSVPPCADKEEPAPRFLVLIRAEAMWDSAVPEEEFSSPLELKGRCCPYCQSARVRAQRWGRKIGSAIGTFAGAATFDASLTHSVPLSLGAGAMAGVLRSPLAPAVGTVAGAVLAAMAAAVAGCALGAALGDAIDANVLENHQCLVCGRRFSLKAGCE